jgi:circadian clock protein KaiB
LIYLMQEKNDWNKNVDKSQSGDETSCIVLKLFITGMAPNSIAAVRNLKAICDQYLTQEEYKLDIIDVYQDPELVKGENIIVTPTLIRKSPLPELKVIGNLSNPEKVIALF